MEGDEQEAQARAVGVLASMARHPTSTRNAASLKPKSEAMTYLTGEVAEDGPMAAAPGGAAAAAPGNRKPAYIERFRTKPMMKTTRSVGELAEGWAAGGRGGEATAAVSYNSNDKTGATGDPGSSRGRDHHNNPKRENVDDFGDPGSSATVMTAYNESGGSAGTQQPPVQYKV